MKLPATGCQNTHRQRGFTLLEILVVIVIIGIVVSIASVGFSSGNSRTQKNSLRLQALMQLASDEAMIHGQEMGLTFYRGGYEFSFYEPSEGQWQVMTQDDMFRPRSLEEDLLIELTLEDRAIELPEELPELKEDEEYQPQVYILSSGEITPFIARFREDFSSYGYVLSVQSDGKSKVLSDET